MIFVTCCASVNTSTAVDVTEQLLSFPSGYYDHVVYIDGHLIAFSFNSGLPPEERVSFAYKGDKKVTPFNPQDDPKCTTYSYFEVMGLLPDGRLGLLKECHDDSAATAFLSTNRSIFAYDWETGELEQLVAGKLDQGSYPKEFTWNPDMTRGVQETISGFPGTIYWIAFDGISPMDIKIEDRGLTWNLKDYFEGKDRTGTARHPAWSPDGKTIAFFVTTYGILEELKPKYNVNYDLYFMDPATMKPVQELMDVVDAGKIVWSPNNENLLFRGCVERRRTCGLWMYRISDKTLTLLKQGEFADYIWITDERIVVAKNIDLPYKDNQVWEYTISK